MTPLRALGVALVVALAAAALLGSHAARADVPGLQIAPLEYEDSLRTGVVKNGYIDVANPGDSQVDVISSVKGFSQIDTHGNLRFYDDPDLSSAITVGLPSFSLGPREAVRVGFTVDPAKLPQGGIYAAIFFRTQPPGQTSTSSFIAESANVGTILMLTNGTSTKHFGTITKLHVPFWQFGYGILGTFDFTNTDRTPHPVGFKPVLSARVLPWGSAPKLSTGLVLPGATRTFDLSRLGAFFGLLPVIVVDSDTHAWAVAWVFACTGWYAYAVLIIAALLLLYIVIRLLSRKHLIPSRIRKLFRRRKPRQRTQIFIDGIGPKSD